MHDKLQYTYCSTESTHNIQSCELAITITTDEEGIPQDCVTAFGCHFVEVFTCANTHVIKPVKMNALCACVILPSLCVQRHPHMARLRPHQSLTQSYIKPFSYVRSSMRYLPDVSLRQRLTKSSVRYVRMMLDKNCMYNDNFKRCFYLLT